MRLNFECISCNINQVNRILPVLKLPREKEELLMKEVLKYLSEADYGKCNPEIMGGTWDIILSHTNISDPYQEIKEYYNGHMLKMESSVREQIQQAEEWFWMALRIAVSGNLIDFMASHQFDEKELEERMSNAGNMKLAIDDSMKLYEQLETAGSLLYIGDNCGEIVLDKVFLSFIRERNPQMKIYYCVRGKSIVNDITRDDAAMVGMDEIAEIIDNGDGSLGCVYSRTSETFQEIFRKASVVIAKGQGNYEGLMTMEKSHMFFLFMAKCKVIADITGVPVMSVVCMEHKQLKDRGE